MSKNRQAHKGANSKREQGDEEEEEEEKGVEIGRRSLTEVGDPRKQKVREAI